MLVNMYQDSAISNSLLHQLLHAVLPEVIDSTRVESPIEKCSAKPFQELEPPPVVLSMQHQVEATQHVGLSKIKLQPLQTYQI